MSEVDNVLVTTGVGGAPAHTEMAARARRSGIWFYAETVLRGMRAFALPIALYAVAQPLLYMIALGVGLGALVDRGVGRCGRYLRNAAWGRVHAGERLRSVYIHG